MTVMGLDSNLCFTLCVLAQLVKPLGTYMARVYSAETQLFSPVLGPLEGGILSPGRRRHAEEEMNWKAYGTAVLAVNAWWELCFLYTLQRLQHLLPLNPMGFRLVCTGLALNTAVSFVTNTNWQDYGGETHHELPDPDAWADRPEFRFCCRRYGCPGRLYPRP